MLDAGALVAFCVVVLVLWPGVAINRGLFSGGTSLGGPTGKAVDA